MADHYQVHIHLEDDILTNLTADGYSLCIQKYLSNSAGKPVANIVMQVKAPGAYSNSTTFKWIDQYYIAASNSDTLYEEGGCLTQPTTDPLPISTATNDAFILTTWSDHKVITDSSLAPENGFAFEPSKKIPDRGASAVVYLTSFVEGTKRLTPFFMSPLPCIGGSNNRLTPLKRAVVFFYRSNNETKSGSMVSHSKDFEQIIDLTDSNEQHWEFGNDKNWGQLIKKP